MIKTFYKKCAVIYDLNGNPLYVADVLDFTTESEYNKLKTTANKNLKELTKNQKDEKEKFKADINKSIYDLAIAVKNYTNK